MATNKKRSYEQTVAELEEVTALLEEGSLPLADMLSLYERGMTLAKEAGAFLDEYEARLTKLTLPAEEDDGI